MLSRLGLTRATAGCLRPALMADGQRFGVAVLLIRNDSNVPASHDKPQQVVAPSDPGAVARQLAIWDAANKKYFGPERDTVNFPVNVQPVTNPPVRFGFIPDTWFQAFYNKTGVTGPYLFGGGLITYLLSKEVWIIEHNFTHFLSFWIAMWIIIAKYGGKIGQYLDQTNEAFEERDWWKPVNKAKDQFKKHIEDTEKAIWREDGQKYLFEAKRENVDLQLESIYRQRLAEVHTAVKKRLDYMVEVESTQRRVQQQHMVQWIVNSVMASITPQQEKESLSKCIQDLKALSAKAHLA